MARVLSEPSEAVARANKFAPMTTLWWAEGDQMIGRPVIRHRPTPEIEWASGHIGYDVRPSARKQGHATAVLSAALPMGRSLGVAEALSLCDDANVASRRVVETNGGRFVDMAGPQRRYLVPTGPWPV